MATAEHIKAEEIVRILTDFRDFDQIPELSELVNDYFTKPTEDESDSKENNDYDEWAKWKKCVRQLQLLHSAWEPAGLPMSDSEEGRTLLYWATEEPMDIDDHDNNSMDENDDGTESDTDSDSDLLKKERQMIANFDCTCKLCKGEQMLEAML